MNTVEDRVNLNSYVQVLQTLGRFHLLPRLQFLYTERNEPQLLFLGSPYLCTFRAKRDLTRNANVDHIQSFLDLLPQTSPKTQALHIRFPLQERSLHAVKRMPELQFLTLDTENTDSRLSLGVDFLTNFSSRRTLDEWFLRGNLSIAPLPASSVSTLDFDSLTYLSFVSQKRTSIAEYTPLLRAGKFPSLERMEVQLKVDDHTPTQSLSPTKLWRDFFKYLRSATTDSLSAIDVMIKGPTACQVSFNDMLDLPSFNLESFETNIFHSLSVVNLFSMLACWPELSVFHISGVDKVTIGFSSLVEIASRFHYLEDLEIQISCAILPTVDHVPILLHNLETLKLWPLHLGNHIALARWIDRIFPELAVLNISGSPPSLKSGVGMEIQEIYEGLQSARKDQRMRDQVSTSSTSHRGLSCNLYFID